MKFGSAYARDVIRNAQVLAESLAEKGVNVLGENHGYTMSHQVAIDVTRVWRRRVVEKKLEGMNIILNRQLLPGDLQAGRHYTNPGGIRLGVSELTRLGMGKSEMKEVADVLHMALTTDKVDLVKKTGARPAQVAPEGEVFVRQLPGVLLPLVAYLSTTRLASGVLVRKVREL